jgi:undecaprenyl-diphosphatase
MQLARHREEWLLLLLAVACLGLAWVFAKMGSEVLEGELLAVDRIAQQWVAHHRSPVAHAFFRFITFLGAKEVLAPLGALVGWRLFRGTTGLMTLLVFAALAAGEFVALLKRSFHVARPTGGIVAGLGYSFPSGHATGSTAIAIVVAYVSIRQRAHARLIVPVCTMIALLVGFSRVYLDVHWASDVIGGWLVGAAFGAGCCALYELLHRRTEVRRRSEAVILSEAKNLG